MQTTGLVIARLGPESLFRSGTVVKCNADMRIKVCEAIMVEQAHVKLCLKLQTCVLSQVHLNIQNLLVWAK